MGAVPPPAPTPTPSPGPGTTTPKTTSSPPPPKPAEPSCTLTPGSSKVLVTAKHRKRAQVGALTLSAHCTQLVTGTLSGKVSVGKGKKRKTYAFTTAHKSLPANRTVTLTLTLPRKALASLAHHAPESAAFKLAFYNAAGSKSVAAKIGALKPER
jgi:hypothetical protein